MRSARPAVLVRSGRSASSPFPLRRRRWLANGFNTLLCFDPTRGIDIGTKRQIYALLRQLAADGAAVLLFTSELAEIPLVCDRAVCLYGGKVTAELDAIGADEATLLRAMHGLESDAA